MSADPAAVHTPSKADLNAYAYVHGQVLKATDPLGLEGSCGGLENCDPAQVVTIPEVTVEGSPAPFELTDEQIAANANLEDAFRAAEAGDTGRASQILWGTTPAPPDPKPDIGAAMVNGALSVATFDWARENYLKRKPLLGASPSDVDFGVQLSLFYLDAAGGAAAATDEASAGALRLTLPGPGARSAETTETTVFRVESPVNERLVIDESGNVEIRGTNMLFLNFGDSSRAEEFLQLRLNQGMDASLKSFRVPNSFTSELSESAVPESMARLFPEGPIRVDVTRASNQFGLRRPQIDALRRAIIPGSGSE